MPGVLSIPRGIHLVLVAETRLPGQITQAKSRLSNIARQNLKRLCRCLELASP